VKPRLTRTTLALGACVLALALASRASAASRPWLFVSDVHAGQDRPRDRISPYGVDTNDLLLESALAEMRRVDPDPPVVVITGDFVWHRAPPGRALSIITGLAHRFGAAFPRAQFLIALGNNDSDCGDYGTPSVAFRREVARAWEPLVNRHGSAPNFERTFTRDGSYVASLPVAGLRAVAIDDRAASLRYRPACGPRNAKAIFGRLGGYLRDNPRRERTWLFFHIPPGMDAFSTSYLTHRLLVVPFLRSDARNELLGFVNDPRNRVGLVVAGHTHKFAYRLSEAERTPDVPILLVPSISPVFNNAPSFLTVEVRDDASVGNVAETSYLGGRWQRIGDFASLGARTFDAPSLLRVQGAIEREAPARSAFERLYEGGAPSEITARNVRAYTCAATELDNSPYRACLETGGVSLLTGRAVLAVLLSLGLAAAVAAAAVAMFRRRPSGRRT